MTRIRIEGLLAAFPKLARSPRAGSRLPALTPSLQVGSGKQHTYVETENVRYVYQPLEVRLEDGDRERTVSLRGRLAPAALLALRRPPPAADTAHSPSHAGRLVQAAAGAGSLLRL